MTHLGSVQPQHRNEAAVAHLRQINNENKKVIIGGLLGAFTLLGSLYILNLSLAEKKTERGSSLEVAHTVYQFLQNMTKQILGPRS